MHESGSRSADPFAGEAKPEVRRECRLLTLWLIGAEPTDYVVRSYARGLASAPFHGGVRSTALDRLLDRVVLLGRGGAALADAYARCFAPAGLLRRKLVLLVAILESSTPGNRVFEPPAVGFTLAMLGLMGAGLAFAFRLLLALPLLGPAHVVVALTARNAS